MSVRNLPTIVLNYYTGKVFRKESNIFYLIVEGESFVFRICVILVKINVLFKTRQKF